MTKIMKCTCDHQFQDKTYGNGNRVFIQTKKSDGKLWRCTVCLREILSK